MRQFLLGLFVALVLALPFFGFAQSVVKADANGNLVETELIFSSPDAVVAHYGLEKTTKTYTAKGGKISVVYQTKRGRPCIIYQKRNGGWAYRTLKVTE